MCCILTKYLLDIFSILEEAQKRIIALRNESLENWIFEHLSDKVLSHAPCMSRVGRAESKKAFKYLFLVLSGEAIVFCLEFKHTVSSYDDEARAHLSFHIDVEESVDKRWISNRV